MVDFTNETTVTTPPATLLKILIIEQRDYVIRAYKTYKTQSMQGADPLPYELVTEVESLFLYTRELLLRKMDKKDFEVLRKQVSSEDAQESMKAFSTISHWMDAVHLIKFDTRGTYDKTDTEAEHKFYSGSI